MRPTRQAACVVVAFLLFASAADATVWRRERVLRVEPIALLPGYVDRHCLGALPASAGTRTEAAGDAVVVRFRVGHAFYYLAFEAPQASHWAAGDLADFATQTCALRRVSSARSSGP